MILSERELAELVRWVGVVVLLSAGITFEAPLLATAVAAALAYALLAVLWKPL